MKLTKRRGNWIQTFTGRMFWPLDPRPDDIDIRDIAHALSNLCRFGGHSLRFYSVAEHCFHVAENVPPKDRLAGLLHDAAEAYLVDVPRPIKSELGPYKEIERGIMRAVTAHFGIAENMPVSVESADHAILTDEQRQIMAPPPIKWSTDTAPLGVAIFGWAPLLAEEAFLNSFRRFSAGRAALSQPDGGDGT